MNIFIIFSVYISSLGLSDNMIVDLLIYKDVLSLHEKYKNYEFDGIQEAFVKINKYFKADELLKKLYVLESEGSFSIRDYMKHHISELMNPSKIIFLNDYEITIMPIELTYPGFRLKDPYKSSIEDYCISRYGECEIYETHQEKGDYFLFGLTKTDDNLDLAFTCGIIKTKSSILKFYGETLSNDYTEFKEIINFLIENKK